MWKKIGWIVLILLVAIQFIRPEQNIGPAEAPAGLLRVLPESVEADGILRKACYDCHSNNTNYPWYSNVQPVGWWLQHHVNEGKEELNFDEFARYNREQQAHKLEEVAEVIEKGAMPLPSYTNRHPENRLTDTEKKRLIDWAFASRTQLTNGSLPDTR